MEEMSLYAIFNQFESILKLINFQPINPQIIGYEFRKNENFWYMCIPIKRNNEVNFTLFENFVIDPNIVCQCLCIAIMDEDTPEEFIYVMGLYQCNGKINQIPVLMKEISNNPDNYDKYMHLTQCISLCCRRESSEYDQRGVHCPDSRPKAKIIRHYVFDDDWIHDSRNDPVYRIGQDEIRSMILAGKMQFEQEVEEIKNMEDVIIKTEKEVKNY